MDVNPFATPAVVSTGYVPSGPIGGAGQAPVASAPVAAGRSSGDSPAFAAKVEPSPSQMMGLSSAAPASTREAELLRRLEELEARERALQHQVSVREKPKNWPPCYPLVRQAVDEDVADPMARRLVKFTFWCFVLHIIALSLNMIGCLAILVSPSQATDPTAGTNFGISVVFLLLGVPLSWVFWYRPLYNASVEDKASGYLIFLCMFAINIIFIGVLIVGIPAGGSTGFINMIQAFSLGKVPAGIICIVAMAALGAELALCIWIIIRVYMHFRGRGGTGAVQREAVGNAAEVVASNPQLAASAASAAFSASRV